MDWAYILLIILGIIISIALFLLLWKLVLEEKRSNNIYKIGKIAELEIGEKFRKWSNKNNAFWIPASLYKINENVIFEVDGIVVTQWAVIVVEIKSIKGEILGIAHEKEWRKFSNGKQFLIKNPLLQNEKHIEHLKQIISKKVPMISMVIFSNRASALKVTHIPNTVFLIKESEVNNYLNDIKDNKKPKIKPKDMKQIEELIIKSQTKNKKDYKKFESFYTKDKKSNN